MGLQKVWLPEHLMEIPPPLLLLLLLNNNNKNSTLFVFKLDDATGCHIGKLNFTVRNCHDLDAPICSAEIFLLCKCFLEWGRNTLEKQTLLHLHCRKQHHYHVTIDSMSIYPTLTTQTKIPLSLFMKIGNSSSPWLTHMDGNGAGLAGWQIWEIKQLQAKNAECFLEVTASFRTMPGQEVRAPIHFSHYHKRHFTSQILKIIGSLIDLTGSLTKHGLFLVFLFAKTRTNRHGEVWIIKSLPSFEPYNNHTTVLYHIKHAMRSIYRDAKWIHHN